MRSTASFALTPFQGVARAAKAEPPFWRKTFDSCDLETRHPFAAADLLGGAGQGPIGPIGHRFFQQGDGDAQGELHSSPETGPAGCWPSALRRRRR